MLGRLLTILSAHRTNLGLPVKTNAERITQIASVGGPGGTGSAMIDLSNPYSAGASLDFTSIDALTIVFHVDGPGYYQIYFNPFSPGGLGMWDPLESTCRHASLSIL